MYKLVIGIDVSKEVLDIAYRLGKEVEYFIQVANSVEGIREFIKALKERTGSGITSSWLVCFENTGCYSKLLLTMLISQEIDCVEENASVIKAFTSVERGKRDDWDAKRICNYAVARQQELKLSKLANRSITKLKHLFRYRSQLVSKRASFHKSVKEKYDSLELDFMKEIHEMNKEIISVLSEKIKLVEQKMNSIISSDESLQRNYELATSVVGIGKIIGYALLIKTENFIKFTDPRKFASQSGIAPFPHQSGKSYRQPRVSKKADLEMKALISNALNAAITHDPQIKKYNDRLIEKGKIPGIRKNNIKNKLIHRVFAVVKRGTPYVKLAA